MKKTAILALIITLIASMLLFTACGDVNVTVDPDDGSINISGSDNGTDNENGEEPNEGENGDAAEHEHKATVVAAVAPTCLKDGKTAGSKCSVCGEILVAPEQVEMKEHVYDDGVITKKPPCSKLGVKTYTCV